MRWFHDGGHGMSAVEFMLGLFGLVIGFILLEVMAGLGRTLRCRLPSAPGVKAEIRIGLLTPLLGAFTMLNVLLCWVNVWELQRSLPFGFDTLTIGLVLCTFYYFAASTIFPGDPASWPDIDEWFWLHRKPVLGSIIAANVPFIASTYLIGPLTLSEVVVSIVVNGLLVSMVLTAMFGRSRRIVTTALALLVAVHLSFVPLEIMHRHSIW